MKLTLTFYEYPAAIHEIENWEKTQEHRIIARSYNTESKEYVFELPGEILVCLPLNDGQCFKGLDTLNIVLWVNTHKFHKTLIFGKVTLPILKKLTQLQEYFEKQKS